MIRCCLMCREALGAADEYRQAELLIGRLRVIGVIHLSCLHGAAGS